MCEPTTLLIAATATQALGQAYSALSANAQARGQAQQAAMNRDAANVAAADALERGNEEQQRHYRKVSAMQGAQRAAMAANGIDIGFGSALDVVGDTAMYGEEDASSIAKNTVREARGFEIQAANFESDRRSAKKAASGALIGGAFNVGSTILGGAMQYRKLQATRSPSFGAT